MTIDEAIKRLQASIAETGDDTVDTLTEAERLGIEALRYIKLARQHDLYVKPSRLPGETEE